MKLNSFFKPGFIAMSLFMLCVTQQSFAQQNTIGNGKKEKLGTGTQTQLNPDLALTDCRAIWEAPGRVKIIWIAKNTGTGNFPVRDNSGESLVSYIVEGSSKDKASSTNADWTQLTESSPLIVQVKELRSGETATGNFTFDSSAKSGLVCYRVTLSTEKSGVVERNTVNNIYIGTIAK